MLLHETNQRKKKHHFLSIDTLIYHHGGRGPRSISSNIYVVLTFTSPSSKMKTTDSSHRVSLLPDRKPRQPDVQRFLRVQWRRQSTNLLDEGRQVHRGFGRGAGSGDWDQVRLSKILPVLLYRIITHSWSAPKKTLRWTTKQPFKSTYHNCGINMKNNVDFFFYYQAIV